MNKEKIYFISDMHLGLYPAAKSREREKVLVEWLHSIKEEMKELYLLGDIFDYWFEFRKVVPRGFVRFLGTLAELADSGVKIHFFIGNHDIWTFNYLQQEIGLTIHTENYIFEKSGKKFFIGHGDGLGKKEFGYRLMNRCFKNKFLQWCFSRVHPNLNLQLGLWWSKQSRYAKGLVAEPFKGVDKEDQTIYAKKILQKDFFDYFIFGHRHLPYDVKINDKTRVLNTGDWISYFTYTVFDGESLSLKSVIEEKNKDITRI